MLDSGPSSGSLTRTHQVLIIGTGFSGIAMAIALKRDGIEDFVVLERADDLGGTWRDNTYPGCACDVPSILYSLTRRAEPALEPVVRAGAARSGPTCASVAERHGVAGSHPLRPRRAGRRVGRG